MQPLADMPAFSGSGNLLNFNVDDVDKEHIRLTMAELKTTMPLEDHPWGDRGYSAIDTIGNRGCNIFPFVLPNMERRHTGYRDFDALGRCRNL
jgi:hypothetical protein